MFFWLLILGIVAFLWALCIAAFGPIAIVPLTFGTLAGAVIIEEA